MGQSRAHKSICKNRKLHKFATIRIVIFKKSIISYMRDRKKYMYINFQQNRVCRSVKTVRTNIYAQSGKLHKFATTNRNFEKNLLF